MAIKDLDMLDYMSDKPHLLFKRIITSKAGNNMKFMIWLN